MTLDEFLEAHSIVMAPSLRESIVYRGEPRRVTLDQPRPKPLAWSEEHEPNVKVPYNHVIAETPLGRYIIDWKGWKKYKTYDVWLRGDCVECIVDSGLTLGEAKELAEKHFYDLVLACLDLT